MDDDGKLPEGFDIVGVDEGDYTPPAPDPSETELEESLSVDRLTRHVSRLVRVEQDAHGELDKARAVADRASQVYEQRRYYRQNAEERLLARLAGRKPSGQLLTIQCPGCDDLCYTEGLLSECYHCGAVLDPGLAEALRDE